MLFSREALTSFPEPPCIIEIGSVHSRRYDPCNYVGILHVYLALASYTLICDVPAKQPYFGKGFLVSRCEISPTSVNCGRERDDDICPIGNSIANQTYIGVTH